MHINPAPHKDGAERKDPKCFDTHPSTNSCTPTHHPPPLPRLDDPIYHPPLLLWGSYQLLVDLDHLTYPRV